MKHDWVTVCCRWSTRGASRTSRPRGTESASRALTVTRCWQGKSSRHARRSHTVPSALGSCLPRSAASARSPSLVSGSFFFLDPDQQFLVVVCHFFLPSPTVLSFTHFVQILQISPCVNLKVQSRLFHSFPFNSGHLPSLLTISLFILHVPSTLSSS